MKMIVTKVRDGYGAIRERYINPDQVRMVGETRDGTALWFVGIDCPISVADSSRELVKQWERCNDEVALKESDAK